MQSDLQKNLTTDPRWLSIRAKLEMAKPILVTVGSVRQRRLPGGSTIWVLRYPEREAGRVRCRSVYLGSADIALQSRVLIAKWRREKELPERARYAETRQLVGLSAAALGFSRRARRRLDAAVEQAMKDPRDLLCLVNAFPDPAIQFGRKPGRPRASGLW